MLKKVILLICDGLGDRPVKDLGGRTPLEAADTPKLDRFAQNSENGLMYTLGRGVVPGSDTAHLAIFGYDPHEHYNGRGPIEAYGIGMTLEEGDVALRGNLGTVKNSVIVDRRAGRIRDVHAFTEAVDGIEIDGVKFIVRPGTAHRAVVVMRGEGLSSNITNMDPKKVDCSLSLAEPKPDNWSKEAEFTAEVLNKFVKETQMILHKHELNAERESEGKLPANTILLRGAGIYMKVDSFEKTYKLKGCCIAGGGLYKGVAAFLGMDIIEVEGATALPDTNIRNKFRKAVEFLDEYDFIFIHVKATDSLAEDGNYIGKRDFTERIDVAFREFEKLDNETLLIVTADHSTPSELKKHSADPVPIMFHGSGVRVDNVQSFGERACSHGGLGIIEGKDLMPQVMNLLGKLDLYGA